MRTVVCRGIIIITYVRAWNGGPLPHGRAFFFVPPNETGPRPAVRILNRNDGPALAATSDRVNYSDSTIVRRKGTNGPRRDVACSFQTDFDIDRMYVGESGINCLAITSQSR